MIKVTIQDMVKRGTWDAALVVPIVMNPIINSTDVETIDGNISTYYGSTKRQYEIDLLPRTAAQYAGLMRFVKRQYENMKYPSITIEGAGEAIDVIGMTAKLEVNPAQVVNGCGLVDGVKVTFRESKQMP